MTSHYDRDLIVETMKQNGFDRVATAKVIGCHPTAVTTIADVDDGYGRLQLQTVRNLAFYAALRIYALGCFIKHSLKKHQWIWTPEEIAAFLGCPGIQIDNLKTCIIDKAIEEIKAVGAFADGRTRPVYGRDKSRGRAVRSIRFMFGCNPWSAQS